MSDWRDRILKEFPTQVARLTLVADPDGLLSEAGILQGLQDRGFDLIEFEDSIAFRYAYESKYRSLWDRGETTDLVVVLRSREQDLRKLPYDLLAAGRKLAFSIPDLFPNLNYPVVEALGSSHFDALYAAQEQEKPARMSSNQTADFILLHVFQIQPKLIAKPAHLLHFLLRSHYRGMEMPDRMNQRFVEVLKQGEHFADWPLEQIIPSATHFYAFLQERWDLCVKGATQIDGKVVKEAESAYGLKYTGPATLPFEHDDVRVYLDNLFSEGLLQPVKVADTGQWADEWISVGISKGVKQDRERRLDHASEQLAEEAPGAEASHHDWLEYARILGDAQAMCHLAGGNTPMPKPAPETAAAFLAWLEKRYGSLHNQPPTPPVMVHHLPRSIAGWLDAHKGARAALLVVDGMSVGQWALTRELLRELDPALRFEERTVYAWIPTLTNVSRQAIFAGKLPQFFPDSFQTTAKESKLWKQFWAERGLDGHAVAHMVNFSSAKSNQLNQYLEDDRVRVLGLVVNTVDNIMHGMQLGSAGMFNQVEQWAREGELRTLIQDLVKHGFRVFITSDHGNVDAEGIGKPQEGALAETRGQRTRIYNDPELRAMVSGDYPDAIAWPQIGLPADVYPLLAPEGKVFMNKGERVVSHGGASLEEVIVPFVTVVGGANGE